MEVIMETEYETFLANVREQKAGEYSSIVITIDKKVADFMGLTNGDQVKVMIKKINKK